jgi:hypothetical protein
LLLMLGQDRHSVLLGGTGASSTPTCRAAQASTVNAW